MSTYRDAIGRRRSAADDSRVEAGCSHDGIRASTSTLFSGAWAVDTRIRTCWTCGNGFCRLTEQVLNKGA